MTLHLASHNHSAHTKALKIVKTAQIAFGWTPQRERERGPGLEAEGEESTTQGGAH